MDPEYRVEVVAYNNAAGLADAMMRAMYEDEHYARLFNMVPIQQIIDDTAKRLSYNLSCNRETKRHEKVIHIKTGKIVGYARWLLPQHLEGDAVWKEAQTPQATVKEYEIFHQDFMSTMEGNRRR